MSATVVSIARLAPRLARAPARPRRAAPRARSALLPPRLALHPPAAGGSRRGLPRFPSPPRAHRAVRVFAAGDDGGGDDGDAPAPPPASSSSSSSSSSSAPLDVSALVAEVTDLSKMGTRDEAYFVAQMLILLFVLVGGGPSKADLGLDDGIFDRLFGVPLLFVAGVLVSRGVADLGDSLTPFPRPRKDNALITSGAYAVVRHPMYAGLIFGAFGLGLLTASPVRILPGVLPAVLLNAAGKEEGVPGGDAREGRRTPSTPMTCRG